MAVTASSQGQLCLVQFAGVSAVHHLTCTSEYAVTSLCSGTVPRSPAAGLSEMGEVLYYGSRTDLQPFPLAFSKGEGDARTIPASKRNRGEQPRRGDQMDLLPALLSASCFVRHAQVPAVPPSPHTPTATGWLEQKQGQFLAYSWLFNIRSVPH